LGFLEVDAWQPATATAGAVCEDAARDFAFSHVAPLWQRTDLTTFASAAPGRRAESSWTLTSVLSYV